MRDVSIEVPDGEINVWYRPPVGESDTVVMVHGLSGNSRWWTGVIGLLPEELGIIALDIRGRGLSSAAPPPFDLATIADDMARSMDHFEIDRAVVAGYSMGGWIAALFGIRHRDRVNRILLVDGGLPLDPKDDVDEFIQAIVGPSLARLEMTFDTEEAFFDQWKTHPAFQPYWDDSMRDALGHELVVSQEHFRIRANPEAITVSARGFVLDPDANQAAASLDVPTHLIVVERGTLDRPPGLIPRATAEEESAANPHLSMEYLPGLNHYTLILGKGIPAVASAIVSE